MKGKAITIGVLTDWIHTPYHFNILEGINEEAGKHNYQVCFFAGSSFEAYEEYHKDYHIIYDLVNCQYFDYLVVLPGIVGHKTTAGLTKFFKSMWSIPVIAIDFELEEYSCVLIDNKTGFDALVTHIIQIHNRKKLVFIKGPANNHDANERFAVFKEVLKRHRIPLQEALIVENDYFITESGINAVKILMDRRNLVPGRDFDAVIAANDAIAAGAVSEFTARKVRIPEDVSVGGFDDSERARSNDPPLTTVRQLTKDLGIEAVKLIYENAQNGRSVKRYLPAQLIIRESCGCTMMNQALTYYINYENLKKTAGDSTQDKALLLQLIIQVMAPASGDEAVKGLIAEFIDAFLFFVNDKNNDKFISNFYSILKQSRHTQLEIINWHKALTILKSWLPNALLPESFIRTLESILDAGNLAISALFQKEEMKDRIDYESYLDRLHTIEDACKINLEMVQLFNVLMDGFTALGFSCFYVFFYNNNADYSCDFKLMLSCTNSRRDSIDNENSIFKNFTGISDKFLHHENIRSWFILPLVESADIFGFIIFNKLQTKHARIVYENVAIQLSNSLKSIKLIAEIRKANKRLEQTQRELEQEIEVARNIQRSLLPGQMMHNDFDIAAEMITAVSVGGDYYDFIVTGEKSWIIIGDVSGHGVHAGLITMMVETCIHLILKKEPDISPLEMLVRVNEVVTENIRKLGETKYMTILILSCLNDGSFTFSGMHLPLLIFRAKTGTVEIIETDGIWLGLLDNIMGLNYQKSFYLEQGDSLLLYTDGVTESMCKSDTREMYGFERLEQVFKAVGSLSSREIIDHIITDMAGFSYTDDDVTLFVLKRK